MVKPAFGSSLEETADPPAPAPDTKNEPETESLDKPGETHFKRVDELREVEEASKPGQPMPWWRRRRPIAAISALVVVGASVIAIERSGADRAHVEAGVTVGGVLLGGRDEPSARAALVELETKLAHRTIPLVLNGHEARFEPSAGGFAMQIDATRDAVMNAARTTGFVGHLRALGRGRTDVPIGVDLDEGAMNDLVDEWESRLVEDHPVSGGVHFDKLTPVLDSPKAGHRIQRAELMKLLRAELARGGSEPIEIPTIEERPTLSQADAEAAFSKVKALVSGPITLAHAPSAEDVADAEAAQELRKKRVDEDNALAPKRHPKKKKKKGKRADDVAVGPPKPPPPVAIPTTLELVFTPADLVAMTRVAPRTDAEGLEVSLDEAAIQRKIDPIANKLADSARDARFEIDDKDQIAIVPSRPGTRVDPKKVSEAIFASALVVDRRGDLPVDHGAPPGLTTEAAEKLGIKGLVTGFTTHHPCCQPRVINIHRIADIMNGALIKPGETFSVNKYVGPRTTDRGFVVAPSIGDGEMVETVGGGISQFATTLFNALFDAGYAIRERKAHSFYFNRYPMGIEATLSDPSPDLVFYNDTDAGILIKTFYDKTSVTVKLYGDNGGRKVERHVSSIFEVTDPKIEYEADDKLEPDEEKVKEKGANGWSLWAGRVITFPNGEKREEKRKITYRARPRLVRIHSCNIPKGEPDYTGKACPKKDKDDSSSASTGGEVPLETPSPNQDAPNDPSHSP